MHRSALITVVLASFALACPADDGDGSGDTHDSEHDHMTGGHDTSGGHASSGGHDDASTGHADDSGSTGHGHATGSTGHADESGSSGHAQDSGTGGDGLAEQWCFCMIDACHDAYHAAFGDEHPTSEENCLAAAAEVPVNGAPTQMGDALECRVHFCAQAAKTGDEAHCESAMGGGMCM